MTESMLLHKSSPAISSRMKIIVTGGRNFTRTEAMFDVLDMMDPDIVVQGGALGADALARLWAVSRGKTFITVPADWARWGKMAGTMRNANMLQLHRDASLVLAFPGGRGTADCLARARDMGFVIWAAQ